ncbi:T9SS type A sorting domain-containing protein [Salinimicrobium flavum]|uniref:T9SS type A sorting domain-containing protein n=1 Tax=Salinimicrobium flavum TaxID=1737065 RepID=A0ABW5J132_9FLAO
MRRIIPFLTCLFAAQLCFSQLFVSPSDSNRDHYLFIKGTVLFVEKEVHLNKNIIPGNAASIYLRGNAQLVQGSQQVPNSGNGQLSLYQTGSSNAYDYNYWASPVGNSAGKNGFFGLEMFYSPQTILHSIPAETTSALNGKANPLSVSNRWIYTYTGEDYSHWQYAGAGTNIPAGHGFSMKGTEGIDPTVIEGRANNPGNAQRYDFRGRPNSGDIEVAVPQGNFVLTGNPYPSTLDLSRFLLENSGTGNMETSCYGTIERNNATTGIAYFWDSAENGSSHYLADYIGGYGAFSPVAPCTMGIYEVPIFISYGEKQATTGMKGNQQNLRFLPIAQGFMVEGAGGSPAVFTNSQRVFINSEEQSSIKKAVPVAGKSSTSEKVSVIPRVRIQAKINDEYVRSLSLAFWPEASVGVDPGMDAPVYDLAPADVGFLFGESSYVIDVRPFNVTEKIPLYLNAEHTETDFEISAGQPEDLHLENIYILDRQTNQYHSIKGDIFKISLAPGNHSGRFSLAFMTEYEAAALPTIPQSFEDDAEDVGFSVLQNNYLKELEIISNSAQGVRSVELYDLMGKRIFFRSNFENRRSIGISTAQLVSGVYIVKVSCMNNSKNSKKIIVFNP